MHAYQKHTQTHSKDRNDQGIWLLDITWRFPTLNRDPVENYRDREMIDQ